MRALLSLTPGGPESLILSEIELPAVPPPGQVRIDVRCCAVNYPDVLMIADRYQAKPPRPFAPGLDVAGSVSALGAGVTDLQVGHRVMAHCRWGGMAEQLDVNAAACAIIPETMLFDTAAAIVTAYGTAYHALLERGKLQPGETVLVLGASGGVGLAAVQVAKALGARVVAAASTTAKLQIALEQGADAGVVYPASAPDKASAREIVSQFLTACGGAGADIVFDVVGGDRTEWALRAIAPEGRLLIIGFTAGIPSPPLNLVLLKRAHIIGVALTADLQKDPLSLRRRFVKLIELFAAGQIRPYISARYSLARGGEAIARLADRSATGKVVVEIPG